MGNARQEKRRVKKRREASREYEDANLNQFTSGRGRMDDDGRKEGAAWGVTCNISFLLLG